MPSTFVALITTSAPISMARNAAAVSGKVGFPVPALKMTARPFRDGEWRGGDVWFRNRPHFHCRKPV